MKCRNRRTRALDAVPGRSETLGSLLTSFKRRAVEHLLRHVPAWAQPEHLTLLTLFWSVLVLAASALARDDRRWLWVVSLLIACQYVTDAIDGKVGKLRNAGLVRWGYYMDHLLDYGFLCAILLGYTILLPAGSRYLMTAVLAVAGGFMISSFLARSITGVLTISYFKVGPIEIRLVFIAINVWLALERRPVRTARVTVSTTQFAMNEEAYRRFALRAGRPAVFRFTRRAGFARSGSFFEPVSRFHSS